MGITHDSLARINRYIQPKSNILIIGCQNMYNTENYGEIAEEYFEKLGHDVISIDILGCNGSYVADLREDLSNSIWWSHFDMVNDCGSKEHIDGSLYQPFKNMHGACKVGGVMIHENPAKDYWPLHGQHYFTLLFYVAFSEACGYEVLELCEEFAMGNFDTGKNICCVLKKTCDVPFIGEKQFNEIYAKHIFEK